MHTLLLLLLTLLGSDPDSGTGQLKLSFGLPVLATDGMLGMEASLLAGSSARPWMIGVEGLSAAQILGSPNESVDAVHVVVAREFVPEGPISVSLMAGFGMAHAVHKGRKLSDGFFGGTYEAVETASPSALVAANLGVSFRRFVGMSVNGGILVCNPLTAFVASHLDFGSW